MPPGTPPAFARRVERVHLAAQRPELGQRQIARPAFGPGRRAHPAIGAEGRRRERRGALAGERRDQDVRGRVQIVLRVPAHQLEILVKVTSHSTIPAPMRAPAS